MNYYKSKKNSWNDAWYQQLRKQAIYSIQNSNTRNIDVDELINHTWYAYARRLDPEEDILKYTLRIRIYMYKYLANSHQCVRFGNGTSCDDGKIFEIKEEPTNNCLESCEEVSKLLSCLNKGEKTYLALHFYKGLNPREIGDLVGLTREAIRQRIKAIIEKVQNENLCSKHIKRCEHSERQKFILSSAR